MHYNNRLWLQDCKEKYPHNFKNCSVLEIGSQNVNGTARDYFDDCEYVGVDREKGKGVDIVSERPVFDRQFDTLLLLSVFEHDTQWEETLKHNLQWLKKGGLCLISFGAEGNLPHMDIWKPVPHTEVIDACNKVGLKVKDAFFEEDVYGSGDSGIFNILCGY